MRRSVTDKEVQTWAREAKEAGRFPGVNDSIPGAREKTHINYGNVHFGKGRGGPHVGIGTPEGTAHLYKRRVYVGDRNFGRGRKLNPKEQALVGGLMDELSKIKKAKAVQAPLPDQAAKERERAQRKEAFNRRFDGGLKGALVGGAAGTALGVIPGALTRNPKLLALGASLGTLGGGYLGAKAGAHLATREKVARVLYRCDLQDLRNAMSKEALMGAGQLWGGAKKVLAPTLKAAAKGGAQGAAVGGITTGGVGAIPGAISGAISGAAVNTASRAVNTGAKAVMKPHMAKGILKNKQVRYQRKYGPGSTHYTQQGPTKYNQLMQGAPRSSQNLAGGAVNMNPVVRATERVGRAAQWAV